VTLPEGWVAATVAEIADTRLGKMLDAAKNKGDAVPYLRNVNVRWGEFDLSDLFDMRVTPEEYDELAVQNGDLFVCEGGEPGRSAVWRAGPRRIVFQKALHRIRPLGGVEPDYLARHLRHAANSNTLSGLLTGTTIKHLPQVGLQRIKLDVPPVAEQRRIVAKLDALTARLARARAELDRVPNLARKLRSAVLQEVYSLSNARTAGIQIVSVGDVADISSGFGFPKHLQGKEGGHFPFAKVSDISRSVARDSGRLSTAANYVDQEDLKVLRARPVATGSTVFAKIGEALRLNRRAITDKAVIIDNNCMALSPCGGIDPEFLFYFMQTVDLSPFAVATAVPSVRRGDVAALELPLPALEGQKVAIIKMKAAFARADRLEAEATRARALIDRLESAILAKAFRGELVPQDPNDEPASVLLDRIRAQRAAAPKAKSGRAVRASA